MSCSGADRRVVAGALLVACLLAAAASPTFAGAPVHRCFGAASLDPAKPCAHSKLRFRVSPSPGAALLEPSSPCAPIASVTPRVCSFGEPAQTARQEVALVGDSHAVHWRAALDVAARAYGWHGLSITRSNCPLTRAVTAHRRCAAWKASVYGWFARHPAVHVAFVSANAGSGVHPRRGLGAHATKVQGYLEAWADLPPSITRIFVLRDVPRSGLQTHACVLAAMARHRDAGRRCARPRAEALPDDFEALAADQAGPRVSLIDLTRFMCDATRCFPVIGGALVIKDIGHLTRTYSTTLGPYLLQELERLRRQSVAARRVAAAEPG